MKLSLLIVYSLGVIIAAWLHTPYSVYKRIRSEYPCTEAATWIIVSLTSWISVIPFIIDLLNKLNKQDNDQHIL